MNQDFLMELLRSNSVSGNETEIEKKIYDHMLPIADAVTVDELGNVTAAVNPDAPFRVLMTGHADEIGLMVTAVTADGFLKVTNIGGIYTTCYPGHKVRVHTKNGILYGAVVNTRELCKKEGLKSSDLTIDMAKREGAAFIVRGVRSVKDYEYEREQAEFNRKFGGLETVLLFAEPGLESVSSSLVRELKFFGRDVTEFLPR